MSPSAYPVAFPRAFASETILFSTTHTVDTYSAVFQPNSREPVESYSVPEFRLSFELRASLFAGVLLGCNLDQAKNCPA